MVSKPVTQPTTRRASSPSSDIYRVNDRPHDLLIRQRAMLANALRAYCTEFDIVVAQGMAKLEGSKSLLSGTSGRR